MTCGHLVLHSKTLSPESKTGGHSMMTIGMVETAILRLGSKGREGDEVALGRAGLTGC